MQLTFRMADGTERVVEGRVGLTVMEVAVQNDIPGILADCGGACACATCHVRVAPDWQDRLPERQTMEPDMLDFAEGLTGSSRLGCQIMLTEGLDGLSVAIPEESL